ncbi:ABC transporter ATP-binding protein [Rubripirellula reticaptiva]|uniref:Putative ABC transporter ATP-binding protein n=1 Tax=Rubripirellula reticaptiva TaxID=2528013 RepID=A0A5C6F6P3_9BACT|nr:ABC transporter ATP-binding protein [Rubripirellula reticaptiva]TWU56144.1 putative ABC transporter ATP-binding protein [Rubripirellula reticaptiva]
MSANESITTTELSNAKVVVRLLRLAWNYRGWCAAMLVLQAVLMGLAVTLVQVGGLTIDVIRFHAGSSALPPSLPLGFVFPVAWAPMQQVISLVVAMIVIAILRAILNYAYALTSGTLVQRKIVVDLRAAVYAKLQRLSLRFYSDQPVGTIINRVTGDVQATRMFIDGVLVQLSILAMSLIVYLTFMLRIHIGLTIACLMTTPVIWGISIRFSQTVRPMYDRTRQLFDDLVLRIAESSDGVAVIKTLGRQSAETERFHRANDAVQSQQQDVFAKVSNFGPLIGFLTQVNLVILLIYGGYLTSIGTLALGTGLIVYAGLLQQFSNQVGNLSGLAGSIQQSLTGARRVFEVLDANEEVKAPLDPWKPDRIRGDIDLHGVWFEYQPGTTVLKDISLHIRAGERIAILGAVGQGKSTLLSLIPRFFDPQCGIVEVDGVDVRQWDLKTLRRSVGLVLQEPLLLSNTIGANIAFGVPGASREQVRMAARLAVAHDFIMDLPDGYDTMLGEFGMSLSGGQRQRLALARAILTDPAILLLDDPVSAIDPETEHEIMTAMETASAGRTTFIVAHRLSTLRGSDRVLVIDEGAIVQEGTHAELVRQEGPYRAVAQSQGIEVTK